MQLHQWPVLLHLRSWVQACLQRKTMQLRAADSLNAVSFCLSRTLAKSYTPAQDKPFWIKKKALRRHTAQLVMMDTIWHSGVVITLVIQPCASRIL